MANRLIRYEACLFRRSLADGFRGPADIALLALLAIIGFAWLRARAEGGHALVLPSGAIWFAALAGPVGFTWQRLAGQRLAWLAEHSPLAPEALAADCRRPYLGVAHLLAAVPLLAASAFLGTALGHPVAVLAIAAAAYGLGAGLASIMPALRRRATPARLDKPAIVTGSGSRAVLALVLARQTFARGDAFTAAGILLAASFALTMAAGWWGRGQTDALRVGILLLPSLALLLGTTRLDAALLGFLPFAGYGPGFTGLAVAALPMASLAAASLAALVTGNIRALPLLGLLHLGFIMVALARAWLYPGRLARSVELQLQLELAGLVAVAILMPPLAVAASGWRLWRFWLHCRGLRWAQP